MSAVHSNISIFVPHIGCPNRCSFCNQRCITGIHKAPRPSDVVRTVNTALSSPGYDPKTTEIAFFGGSFTAIEHGYMLELLKTAREFVRNGSASGIRISTRPDAIDDEILSLLKEHCVTAIELGAQSLDDNVLRKNNRGHSADDVRNASEMIQKKGFSLGLQMMTGLYGDSDESAVATAKGIIALKPDTVRIYPTIVLKDTYLAGLYADGLYRPQTLQSAVSLASRLLPMFDEAGIRVIRLGLHSIEQESYIAGPWHPAFSELCQNEIFLDKALAMLHEHAKYILYVNRSSVSKMVGQHRRNLEVLKEKGFDCCVKIDDSLGNYRIKAERLCE